MTEIQLSSTWLPAISLPTVIWVHRVLLGPPGFTLLPETSPASFFAADIFSPWSLKAAAGSLLNFPLIMPGVLCRPDHGSSGFAALEVLPRQSWTPFRMWRWGWGRARQPIVFSFGAWAKNSQERKRPILTHCSIPLKTSATVLF